MPMYDLERGKQETTKGKLVPTHITTKEEGTTGIEHRYIGMNPERMWGWMDA